MELLLHLQDNSVLLDNNREVIAHHIIAGEREKGNTCSVSWESMLLKGCRAPPYQVHPQAYIVHDEERTADLLGGRHIMLERAELC